MELLPDFDLVRPPSVDEALAAWREAPEARYFSGGTDLLPNMRRGFVETPRLIDLSGVDELKTIEAGEEGLTIGAAVTLDEVAAHPALTGAYSALAQAAGSVAGPTQRLMGTVGGNLCLDTRCYFYNQSEWWRRSIDYCLKYRGEICHVVPSSKRCYAAYSGDLAPALLVLGAELEVAGPEGRRRFPLDDLFVDDGMEYLTLRKGELVVAVRVPAPPPGLRSGYEKLRVRGSIDFPLAGVAIALRPENGVLAELRVALTGVGSRPLLLAGTEALVGPELDDEALAGLEKLIHKQSSPVRTALIQPQYRRRAIAGIAARLLRELVAAG